MHEIRYALDILRHIERASHETGGKVPGRVKVRLGAAKGILPEMLGVAFDWVKHQTIAEETQLEVDLVPIKVRCTLCEVIHSASSSLDECPHCGALGGEILTGDEFEIEDVVVEEELVCH